MFPAPEHVRAAALAVVDVQDVPEVVMENVVVIVQVNVQAVVQANVLFLAKAIAYMVVLGNAIAAFQNAIQLA